MGFSNLPPEQETALRFRVKGEIRKRLRAVRKVASATACLERSIRIVGNCFDLDVVQKSHAIALFWPILERNEVDLRTLDAGLRAQGKRIAYPALNSETNTILFRWVSNPDELIERGARFPEPDPASPAADPSEIAVVFVPAIAIDPRGYRIGYGSGHYDQALTQMPSAVFVGVAYDYQLIPEVANTDGDIPMHWVVTDTRVMRADS